MGLYINLHQQMNVHEKIRLMRQSKGFTQEYLAEKLHIDAVNYGRIERGQSKLTVDRMVLICEILEISPAELFERPHTTPSIDNSEILEKIFTQIQEINSKLK